MAIDIPNPFKNLPKPVLYGGIAVTTAITGYLLWSHHKKTGSWFGGSATATATGTDPVTGLPYSQDNVVDPVTGETYLAEAEQYGSVATAEASVSSFGTGSDTGTGIGVNPASGGAGASTPATGSVGSPVYTSNSAWAQAVQAGLSAVSGSTDYDGTDIGTALGAYLTGTPLTPGQIQVVKTALAEYGPPPIGTFQIIPAPATGPATTTTGTSPSVPSPPGATGTGTPPPVTTGTRPIVKVPGMPTGVVPTGITTSGFVVRWNPVAGATEYRVRVTYQSAAVYDRTVSGTSDTVSGLSPNRTYTIHVAASNSAGTSSETNGPSAKTKA